MQESRIKTYREFYRFYLTEHQDPTSRTLHFIGTFLIFVLLGISIYLSNYALLWAIPLVGYGFAWIGHFFFERNRPATFRYPIWSLISDFRLFFEILTGKQSLRKSH